MTPRTSRELLAAAGVLAAAFLALTLWVRFGSTIPGDAWGITYAREHIPAGVRAGEVYTFLGSLGTSTVGLLTTLTIAVVVFVNLGARQAALVLGAALIVFAERPVADAVGTTDAATEVGFPGGGYPSGHVLYVTAVFGMTAVLGRRHGRPEVTFLAVTLIVAMAAQRVVTGSHLVDEVLGALLLGGAWLTLTLAAGRQFDRGTPVRRRT